MTRMGDYLSTCNNLTNQQNKKHQDGASSARAAETACGLMPHTQEVGLTPGVKEKGQQTYGQVRVGSQRGKKSAQRDQPD